MSGQQIGGAIGFVVGAYFGYPQLGYMLGSAVGGYVDPQHIQGPTLGDLPMQTASEGAPRPIVYGRPQPFHGNLLQSGDYIRIATHEQQGKGGGPVIDGEKVYLTYAIRICEGPALPRCSVRRSSRKRKKSMRRRRWPRSSLPEADHGRRW